MFASPIIWVAVAFAIFIGLLLYFRVHKMIAEQLDKRSGEISRQLDEARRLREEAQSMLAKWQRQQRQADEEANEIVRQAEANAQRSAEETRAQMEETLKRREEQSAEKIAQAEARAVQEVRGVAVDVATEVARRLIREELDKQGHDKLIDESIQSIDKSLH